MSQGWAKLGPSLIPARVGGDGEWGMGRGTGTGTGIRYSVIRNVILQKVAWYVTRTLLIANFSFQFHLTKNVAWTARSS